MYRINTKILEKYHFWCLTYSTLILVFTCRKVYEWKQFPSTRLVGFCLLPLIKFSPKGPKVYCQMKVWYWHEKTRALRIDLYLYFPQVWIFIALKVRAVHLLTHLLLCHQHLFYEKHTVLFLSLSFSSFLQSPSLSTCVSGSIVYIPDILQVSMGHIHPCLCVCGCLAVLLPTSAEPFLSFFEFQTHYQVAFFLFMCFSSLPEPFVTLSKLVLFCLRHISTS